MPPVGPLPDLSGMDIALDTETKDEGLENERGPGWVYKLGYIAGVSVAWAGGAIYVPVRHPDTECRSMSEVMPWVENLLRRNRVHFFNMGYDMGWLQSEGCAVWPEAYEDASAMAVMLDENWDSYSLDSCCRRAGIEGKDEALLNRAAVAFGIKKKYGSYKHGLWRLPARYVGPYAEQDGVATLQLSKLLLPQIIEQDVERAYRTEMKLLPVISKMRSRGIRIDEEAALEARSECIAQRDERLAAIAQGAGRSKVTMDDLQSPTKLATLFDLEGIQYPRTAKTGQPSFTAEWLEAQPGRLAALVRRSRQMHDVATKFIDTYILGFAHRGRIHAEIHPLRGDTGGTVTSRFAYSNPPLQQMPARDPVLGPMTRNIFLPEEDTFWFAPDYSQQEPRLAVHFSALCKVRGADAAVAYYRDRGAAADFHQMVSDLAGIPRSQAKIINLGLMYGMGLDKLARSLGLMKEDAEELMKVYHGKVPWVKLLTEFCEGRVRQRGFIRLIDGARRHYDEWEPMGRGANGAARQPRAAELWPNQPLRRAYARTAFNSLIQGSAARQTKMAMVQCHSEGFLPMIQMHDELCFSVDREQDGQRIGEIMRNIIKLEVPVRVDEEYGPRWGKAKFSWAKLMEAA